MKDRYWVAVIVLCLIYLFTGCNPRQPTLILPPDVPPLTLYPRDEHSVLTPKRRPQRSQQHQSNPGLIRYHW